MNRRITIAVLTLLCGSVYMAGYAQVPRTLSYQGVLTDTSGHPKPDGTYSFTFRFYASAGGGSALWTENKTLQVSRGLFNSVLGDQVPITLPFDVPYWLGIQVAAEAELTPRIPLTSVGYSMHAASADTAAYARVAPQSGVVDSARIAGTIPDNTISTAKLVDNGVTTAKLAAASVTSAKIAGGQVVRSLNGVTDIVTFRATGGATITSNGDTLTINAGSGGSGTGIQGVQNTNNTLDVINPNGPTATLNVKNGGIGTTQLADNSVTAAKIPSGNVVKSINTLKDDVTLSAGSNISITPSGNTLTIAASSGLSVPFSASTSSASTLFSLTNTGSGAVGNFAVANNTNTTSALTASTTGTGRAGYFTISNNANNSSAIEGRILSGTGSGVSGYSTSAYGIYGESANATGVLGYSPANIGVAGLGGPTGVYGKTTASTTNAVGVYGEATASSGSVYGVRGDAVNSTSGIGVYGTGGQYGGFFNGGSGRGIFAVSSQLDGVWGVTNTNINGIAGVLGVAPGSTGGIIGVRGAAVNSPSGIGVQGEGGVRGVYGYGSTGVLGESSISGGTGVVGFGFIGSGVGVLGSGNYQGVVGSGATAGVYGSSSNQGVRGISTGAGLEGVYGEGTNSNGTGVRGVANIGSAAYGLWGQSSTGFAIVCGGAFLQGGGTFTASPTSTTWTTNKPATVKLQDGSKIKLFAEEAAEVYFSDYGEGRLRAGRAHITLDPSFVQTVTIDDRHPAKVFVQLEGDCRGVYVTNKTAAGFDVVELQGGNSDVQFSYRVVCKRKYYEDERLASEEQDKQFNKRMLETVWPEELARQKADEERGARSQVTPEELKQIENRLASSKESSTRNEKR